MLYIITGRDKQDSANLRQQNRNAHLAYWQGFGDRLRFGGPFVDETGAMCGSMLALEAENYDKACQAAENDPYNKAGLFAEIEVRGWQWVIKAPKA